MHATLWPVAIILLLVIYKPLEAWLFSAIKVSDDEYPAFRGALVDWLRFTVPLLVGGAVAAIYLRPGVLRILGAAGCAAATAVVELVGVPALSKADVTSLPAFDLVYAVSLTAASLGWLILRGRSGSRLPIALATLPLSWLLLYLLGKILRSHWVLRVLDFHYSYLAFALLTFLAEALAIVGPAWLAAIGARPGPGAVGRPAFPAAPAGWAGTSAGAPSGPWPAPGAPAGAVPAPGAPAGPWAVSAAPAGPAPGVAPAPGAPAGPWVAPGAPAGPWPQGPDQGTASWPGRTPQRAGRTSSRVTSRACQPAELRSPRTLAA